MWQNVRLLTLVEGYDLDIKIAWQGIEEIIDGCGLGEVCDYIEDTMDATSSLAI